MDTERDLITWVLERRVEVRETLQDVAERGAVIAPEDLASLRVEEQLLTEMLVVAGVERGQES